MKSQTITVPSINPLVQNYTYDSLNRIKSATETQNSAQTWKQTFTYDRYGNRTFDASNTTTIPTNCTTAQCNPSIDAANNRFTTGQGYTYDLSGNPLTDAQNRTFIYDAENKQKTVSDASGTIGTYFYDGDGKRVKKVSAAETTIFAYDASGKLAAEYTLTSATPQTPVTSYLTSDTLGSPRVITDTAGNVTSRRDFMPFGEEIANLGGRASANGYQADSTRQKFTGYEKDSESTLEYAKARYFNSIYGRFSSPDPFGPWAMSEKEKAEFYIEPQKWNLYVYVTNNPLKYSDPTGFERYDKNTVSQIDEDKIRKALKAILKYGTPEQKQIVRNIQKSDLLIKIAANTGGSGAAGVTDSVSTQQKIDTQRLNVVQALGELNLTIDSGTLATQQGIEGTLVHETRHASHQAKAISEFSYGDTIVNPFDPDGFALEYAAHKSYGDYVIQANKMNHPDKRTFVNEAIGLGVIAKNGNTIGISERGIRARLADPNAYNSNDTTKRGTKFGQHWNLTPRNSW